MESSTVFNLFYNHICEQFDEDEEKCIEKLSKYENELLVALDENTQKKLKGYTCALRNEFDLMLFKNLQETLNYGIKIGMEIKEFELTKEL